MRYFKTFCIISIMVLSILGVLYLPIDGFTAIAGVYEDYQQQVVNNDSLTIALSWSQVNSVSLDLHAQDNLIHSEATSPPWIVNFLNDIKKTAVRVYKRLFSLWLKYSDFTIVDVDQAANIVLILRQKLSDLLLCEQASEFENQSTQTLLNQDAYNFTQASLVLNMLLDQDQGGYYNIFNGDPYSDMIPDEIKTIYSYSPLWSPKENHDDSYVQCITLVYMVYELAGHPITPRQGNAITFSGYNYEITLEGNYQLVQDDRYAMVATDLETANESSFRHDFISFESNHSREIPQVGDIVVWTRPIPTGHTGIITQIDHDKQELQILNANAPKKILKYLYHVDNQGRVSIIHPQGGGFTPNFWVRSKDLLKSRLHLNKIYSLDVDVSHVHRLK